MLSLSQIQRFYPPSLHGFGGFLLREYLQYKILEIIFESSYASRLCFLGGTCLRIIHGNMRFSEDLDFDNFQLSEQEFSAIGSLVKSKLSLQGYHVEVKQVIAGAFHCYIKFPGLLYDENLSGHKEAKILIQLDTEPQHFDFEPEPVILNKFDVFTSIHTTPIDILLSQKFFALINRKQKKGRDFYDVVFLLKHTSPNYNYLNQKLGIKNRAELKQRVLAELEAINLPQMANDVKPFLFNAADIKTLLLFEQYVRQAL
ncbi:MAG: nucleotidyl transferase AbiEii/AbiGii toxin family protein [Salinivirgaceae bacterium]